MAETKLRLSLNVPGAQLLSEQECSKNPKESYDTTIIPVEFYSKKGKLQKENVVVKTRKQRTVKQSLNISKEAYNHMIDPEAAPTERLNKKVYIKKIVGKKPNGQVIKKTIESTVWAQYQLKQRLEWHLSRIAESLRAVGFTYEVFED